MSILNEVVCMLRQCSAALKLHAQVAALPQSTAVLPLNAIRLLQIKGRQVTQDLSPGSHSQKTSRQISIGGQKSIIKRTCRATYGHAHEGQTV